MGRFSPDLVVGLEDRLGDERSHVASLGAVDGSPSLAAHGHEPPEAQLREVLGSRGARGANEPGEGSDIVVLAAQRPQQPQPGGVGQQAEGFDGCLDLLVARQLGPRIGDACSRAYMIAILLLGIRDSKCLRSAGCGTDGPAVRSWEPWEPWEAEGLK